MLVIVTSLAGQLIQGVVIDGEKELVYFMDSALKQAGVMNLNGSGQRVLFTEGILQPEYIVLDPEAG